MITPVDFKLTDFVGLEFFGDELRNNQLFAALQMEDLHGAELLDNLILLKCADLADVQEVLQTKYKLPFAWLNINPTPPELRNLADKYEVLLQREAQYMIVYIQLGAALDEAALQIDIPNYRFRYVFIADCNYRILKTGLRTEILNYQLAEFRPLLVLRRLILDCNNRGGTDLHFVSYYINKAPVHKVQYRIKRQLVPSDFILDREMTWRVVQAAIAKLSTSSASDLDSIAGVSTDISDLFGDGTTDLRVTGMLVSAGLYVNIAIQSTATTNKTVDELGFPKADVAVIREIARRRTGLTLVTGELRSGKNTTIFAMLNEILDLPIRIMEFSNPIENRMPFPQVNYKGDIDTLKNYLRLAKKLDIDLAVLNEIPNAEVAFAVRDLVNSSIGVMTTTHVDRVWNTPGKLHEFYGPDYKTIISQLNVIINHKMFRRWSCSGMQKRVLQQGPTDFEKFAYSHGVRQYFVPVDAKRVSYTLQPLTEIIVLTPEQKTAMLNFDELWKAEQMLRNHIEKVHGTIENKLAQYINEGICDLNEMRNLF